VPLKRLEVYGWKRILGSSLRAYAEESVKAHTSSADYPFSVHLLCLYDFFSLIMMLSPAVRRGVTVTAHKLIKRIPMMLWCEFTLLLLSLQKTFEKF